MPKMLAQANVAERRSFVMDNAQIAANAADAPPKTLANVDAATALWNTGRARNRTKTPVGNRQTLSTRIETNGGAVARSSERLRNGKRPHRAAIAPNRQSPTK